MTTLRSLALVAVASSAVGLAGCGGSDSGSASSGSSTDARALLVNTFQPSGDAGKLRSGTISIKLSGKMTGTGGVDGSAEAKIALNEAKDGEVPEFKADIAVDGKQEGGSGLNLKAGGTYTGGRFYITYDGDNYDVGDELSKRAISSLQQSMKQSSSAQGGNQVLGQLGLNPERWLTDPKVEGDEQIGGVDTYKISGAVNLKEMVPDILGAARKAQSLTGASGVAGTTPVPTVTQAQLDEVAKQVKKLDVTIWTGKDDKILRQLVVDVDIAGSGAAEKGSLTGKIQLTLSGVNEKQDIAAPSDTKPLTDLMPKLGGLLGAAGGLGGATSGAASSGALPSVSDAYVQCVNAAGGDAAKLNACQSELTK